MKISMSAVILAGGKSSRMGRDKALLKFGGQTMIEYLVGLVSGIFSETLVVVRDRDKFRKLDLAPADIYEDLIKDRGPLAGVYTGLVYSAFDRSCVFTCDMPLVDEALVRRLTDFWQQGFDSPPGPGLAQGPQRQYSPGVQAPGEWPSGARSLDAVCLENTQGGYEPFPGIYLRSGRHWMRMLLDHGEGSLKRYLEVATVKPLVLEKEKIRLLTNMNTIEDYYHVLREKSAYAKDK